MGTRTRAIQHGAQALMRLHMVSAHHFQRKVSLQSTRAPPQLSGLAGSGSDSGSPTDVGWGHFNFGSRSGTPISMPPVSFLVHVRACRITY